MKTRLLKSVLLLGLVSGVAVADPISIDPDFDGDTSNATEQFGKLSTGDFAATSYYVDQDGDGTISTGEFVFDFGLDVIVNAFTAPDLTVSQASNYRGVGGWELSMDYLIYGAAVVVEDPSGFAAVADPGYAANGEYDMFGDVFPGVPYEALAAGITDGMLNMFIQYDTNGDGLYDDLDGDKTLVSSYLINGVNIAADGVSLDMFADGDWALDDFFYTQWGQELNDAVANGAEWTGQVTSTVEPDGLSGDLSVPGTYNPNGEPTYVTVDGVDIAYYGETATEITQDANGCPIGSFGGCVGGSGTGANGVPFEVTETWRQLRDTIRNVAGDNDILARQTTLNATFAQSVPEPGVLASFGLGLLGLAALGRRKAKK